ncbi:PspA/IM30 family protein [Sulfobacillus thermosulfidooxidans]|uniref:PspA/IM30 family protein n=1 Tax=Sulfobacillus thermosulfidooxidans TaxID=28034 RepID=UPI0004188A7C|nr:PspA/IM30 family protein [Sulfobacillus thermosulfidooxidans]
MAGLLERVKTILGSKANRVLDSVEDPTETIEYSYQKMQDALQETRRHILEVATAKKQLEMQVAALQQKANQYALDAKDAVQAGRDDLATQALSLKATTEQQIQELQTHIQQTQAEQDKLMAAQQKLETQIETFRTQKEVMKAQYSAAKAEVQVGETVHGITQHAEDISGALQRAQDKIAHMQAKASALDELESSPDLTALPESNSDTIRQQLNKASQDSAVQEELAKLKQEMQQSAKPLNAPSDSQEEQ